MPFIAQSVGKSNLRYPENKWRIAFMSQPAKEKWYAAQDPKDLAASSKEFQEFWSRWYLGHVKLKRLIFRLKFW